MCVFCFYLVNFWMSNEHFPGGVNFAHKCKTSLPRVNFPLVGENDSRLNNWFTEYWLRIDCDRKAFKSQFGSSYGVRLLVQLLFLSCFLFTFCCFHARALLVAIPKRERCMIHRTDWVAEYSVGNAIKREMNSWRMQRRWIKELLCCKLNRMSLFSWTALGRVWIPVDSRTSISRMALSIKIIKILAVLVTTWHVFHASLLLLIFYCVENLPSLGRCRSLRWVYACTYISGAIQQWNG